ncbi:MAG: hypothetical protein ACFCGT_17650 [Sandaracinaceae bacterium]
MGHRPSTCTPRSARHAVVWALALTLAAGCAGPGGPGFDLGVPPSPDGGLSAFGDEDRDGLCNRTEAAFRTDPFRLDTDGDGLPDRAEIEAGFRATNADSPEGDRLVILLEAPGERAALGVVDTVDLSSEGARGAYRSLAFPEDPATSDTYFDDLVAVSAVPARNVFEIVPGEGLFRGVDGRTQLLWEVRFIVPDDVEPRGCAQALPFEVSLRVEERSVFFRQRHLLLVLPPSDTTAAPAYCPFDDCL